MIGLLRKGQSIWNGITDRNQSEWLIDLLRNPHLEVIDERTPLRSTLIASQLLLEHWDAALAEPTVADAILERGAHQIQDLLERGIDAEGDP